MIDDLKGRVCTYELLAPTIDLECRISSEKATADQHSFTSVCSVQEPVICSSLLELCILQKLRLLRSIMGAP